jgi:hypothetical protein
VESRIGQLHYRVWSGRGARIPPGLEQVARERVGEALGQALEAAFGDDPSVYVLRDVRADIALDTAAHHPDRLIAEEWAQCLATAIAEAISADGDEDVVRFADEAEFVACFAADLAGGVAWERWFYGAFAELRALGSRAALRTVLLGNRGKLPAILAWLARHRSLERVLAALDRETLDALQLRLPDPELLRPLMAVALRIAEAIGARDAGRLELGELSDRYLAATQVTLTWRDRGSLADGVLDALRFLRREGLLDMPEDELAGEADARAEPLLAELDWLDVARLRAGLAELLTGDPEQPAPAPAAPARGSRERALLRELGAALGPHAPALDIRDPASAANALRLRAALAAHSASAGADPRAAAAVGALLAAVARLARHPAAAELWELAAAGDESGALRVYGEAGAPAADLELLGEAGSVLASFGAAAGPELLGPSAGWIETPCAGALLPIRGALDIRLPELAAAVGAPPFPELMLAMTLRWGGAGALDARADAALSAALGFERPPTAGELAEGWADCSPGAHRRLRAEIRSSLRARGHDSPLAAEAIAPGGEPCLGDREADLTVALAARAALGAWASWLRGFSASSEAFLLDRFVRRPGRVSLWEGRATVELEPRPLDLVLQMAGYLDELDAAPELPRRIGFVVCRG